MTRRRLLIVPFLLAHAAAAQALGLGDIELKSALNQPFEAEIPLHAIQGDDLKTIVVDLAPNATFEKAGVDRHPVLNQLVFTVQTRKGGGAYVRVTSNQAIREPFLDFIVAVSWPAGQLLREYTVLLDPPVLTSERPAPVQPAETAAVTTPAPAASAAAQPARARTPDVSPATKAAPAASAPRAGANEYGPTGRADTLWSIAEQMRPDNSVTIPQTMMALLRSNPDAFYHENINDLKAGYVLRLDQAQLNAMSRADAERESHRHYQEWQARRRGEPVTPVRPQGALPESAGTGSDTASADSGPRLKLVAPTEEELRSMEPAGTVSSGEGAQETVEGLRKELALAMETADRTTLENEAMKQRIASLEAQIADMQRLVTLQDDTLATIQSQPGEQAAEPAPPVEAAAGEEPGEEPATNPVAELMASPVVFSTVIAVALGVLFLGWKSYRRRQLEALETDVFTPASVAATASAAAALSARDTGPAQGAAVATQMTAPASAFDAQEGHGISTEVDDIDVLSEADVYLAYHRYSQAETLIKGAIEHHPDQLDLKLKLLEIYFAAHEKDKFIAQAERLHDAVGGASGEDSELWMRATALGQEMVPEHPLFGGADTSAKNETAVVSNDALTADATDASSEPPPKVEMSDEVFERRPAQQDNSIEFESGLYDTPAPTPVAENTDSSETSPAFALDSSDVVATKLDLAKAYVDMGDRDGARSILEEVLSEGNEDQKREAQELLGQIG